MVVAAILVVALAACGSDGSRSPGAGAVVRTVPDTKTVRTVAVSIPLPLATPQPREVSRAITRVRRHQRLSTLAPVSLA